MPSVIRVTEMYSRKDQGFSHLFRIYVTEDREREKKKLV
jgi:hypothetical protein